MTVQGEDLIIYKIEQLTIAVNNRAEKADAFQKEMYEALNGCDEYPGIRGRLRDVEATTGIIKKVFWTVVTPVLGGLSAFIFWKW